MKFSPTPDLGPWRRMLLAALATAVVVIAILVVRDGGNLGLSLGDTDDAMRLVMMRALAAGQGWFDQKIMRLQPPLGVFMHWSRLIDGGLAALNGLFRLGLPAAQAETATRFVWPLLWVAPACWAGMAAARRLGGGAAVFAAMIIAAIDISLFLQFRPGRIDHHDVQITLCMLSLAGAALGSKRGAVLAGAATGLGIAIGLEALVFEVLIGGYFALTYLFGWDKDGVRLRNYAVALGAATIGFYLLQTPPSRWTTAACDAIAVNLVAAVAVASAGLVLAVRLTRDRDWRFRLAALAVTGAAAAALYVGLDANCLKGPFADVDDRLKVFWLPNVQEIRPVPRVWRRDHETAYVIMVPAVMGLIAWIGLNLSKGRRLDPFLLLAGACLIVGGACGWSAIRMGGYANWFALPLLAAAIAALVERYLGGAMLALAVGACAVTPLFTSAAAAEIDKRVVAALKPPAKAGPKPKPAPGASAQPMAATQAKPKPPAKPKPAAKPVAGMRGDRCFQTASYAALGRQPAGLVLSEVDLGPFILAHSPSSAMAAPYHRMNWGLVAARDVLSTPSEKALGGALKLGVAYVLDCPPHGRNADRVGMPDDSLQKRLDAAKPPSWLEPVDIAGPLKLYRVRPSATAPAPAASAR